MTNRLADALVNHIEGLSRESQVDSLRSVLSLFKVNNAKFRVLKALKKCKADISDMAESYRAMP